MAIASSPEPRAACGGSEPCTHGGGTVRCSRSRASIASVVCPEFEAVSSGWLAAMLSRRYGGMIWQWLMPQGYLGVRTPAKPSFGRRGLGWGGEERGGSDLDRLDHPVRLDHPSTAETAVSSTAPADPRTTRSARSSSGVGSSLTITRRAPLRTARIG